MRDAASLIAAAVLLLVFSGGCARKSKPAPKLPDLNQRLVTIGATADAVAKELPRTADRIDQHAKAVNTKAKGVADVQPEIVGLATETAGLRASANRLAEVPGQVKSAQSDAAKYVTAVDSANARVAKLEDEKKSSLRKLLGSVVFICVIGLGVSGALFATGNKLGITTGAGCLVALVAAVTVGWYATWLAVIFAVVFGVALVVGIVYIIRRLRVEKRATKDLVRTVEMTKQSMPPEMRLQLFGNGAMPGIVESSSVQSATTKAEVKAIRETEGARLAPEVAPVSVNVPGTVPGPAVSVPTA